MPSANPRHPITVATSRRLRRDSTDVEKRLWRAIRDDALNARFRRQHPIGRYFADFACVEAKLVVEVDGCQHSPERDGVRDAELTARGWHVLRFWNNEVLNNLDGVVFELSRVLRERLVKGSPPP